MKITALAAAGLAALTVLAPVAAGAQTRVVTHTVTRTHTGPAYRHHHVRRVCHVTVRHHHRVRTCRVTRY